jgi:hypothetical protein
MRDDLYAVVEHNQASGQPDDQGAAFFWNLDEAVQHADSLTEENRANGRREQFRIFTLTQVDESDLWEWGTRRVGTGEEPRRYVHEYAARRSWFVGHEVMRRRRGTKEWTTVCPCLGWREANGGGCERCSHTEMDHNEDTGTCWSVMDAIREADFSA